MRVAFIGLGQMGRHMARNLVRKGHEVGVYARRADLSEEIAAIGATPSRNLLELANTAPECVCLCLPDGAAVKDVLFATGNLADHLKPGTIVVDTSTTTYDDACFILEALTARGIDFLDAPVSGMEARAREGTLTVMCGGDNDVLAKARPVLEGFASRILHFGPAGTGQLAKLINQVLFDVNAAALAEVLPMAAKLGLDPSQIGEVVNTGTGKSHASEFFIPRMLKGVFDEGYPMGAAYKDLVSVAQISARLKIPLPVTAAATATYQAALLAGHEEKDKGGMICIYEKMLGVEFRSKKVSS